MSDQTALGAADEWLKQRLVSIKLLETVLGKARGTVDGWVARRDNPCPVERRANRDIGMMWLFDLAKVIAWLEERAAESAAVKFAGKAIQGDAGESQDVTADDARPVGPAENSDTASLAALAENSDTRPPPAAHPPGVRSPWGAQAQAVGQPQFQVRSTFMDRMHDLRRALRCRADDVGQRASGQNLTDGTRYKRPRWVDLRKAAFERPSQEAEIHSGTGATQLFGTSMPRLTAGRSPIRAIQACKFGIVPSVSC
jgi:hypothetical protein